MEAIRHLVAKHALPLCAVVLTAGVHAAYDQWPILDAVAPESVVLASLSGVLAGVFYHLDPWLSKRAPWFVQPPKGGP